MNNIVRNIHFQGGNTLRILKLVDYDTYIKIRINIRMKFQDIFLTFPDLTHPFETRNEHNINEW